MKQHYTVLKTVAVEALAIKTSSVVVDATLGAGGHAEEILARLGTHGVFIGIDADEDAVLRAQKMCNSKATTHFVCDNFRNINSITAHLHSTHIDAILADLGWRMDQFGGNGKGFSFLVDEPLVMTFGDSAKYAFAASDIVNEWEEQSIYNVLKGYGEERFAGRIARAIVAHRQTKPIASTFELVNIIKNVVPHFYRTAKIHPATRTFQALRIAVNDEFGALEAFIHDSIALLAPQGRLVIITFHSLEDRIVKHLFRAYARDHVGTVLTKKPITESSEMLQVNPRARSAKLRVFEKI